MSHNLYSNSRECDNPAVPSLRVNYTTGRSLRISDSLSINYASLLQSEQMNLLSILRRYLGLTLDLACVTVLWCLCSYLM